MHCADVDDSLALGVLDFVGIEYGEDAHSAIDGAVSVARAVEAAGYRRYWMSEHHNMANLACSAPELLIAHLGARTERIRVGAAGIMLPNHAALKVAEMFRTLVAMYPGRVDLALGRAPGTDPVTAHALRGGVNADAASEFPAQVGELFAFLGEAAFPDDHPYRNVIVAPQVKESPELFMLGSSGYGARFAAINGMRAVFAHHMSPDIAIDTLRAYRRTFVPRVPGDEPYSAMSVLAFASDDPDAIAEFEAGWTLTIDNLRRGIRQPLRPEEVREFATSGAFRSRRGETDSRMVTGSAPAVVARLRELQAQAEADEIVVVTPALDRARRIASYRAVAGAWRG